MKNTLYISSLIILLTSCKGTGFLNRKYTSGHFVQHYKTVKHNTLNSDSTKLYASTHKREIRNTTPLSNICSEKEIIKTTVNSILKKDSIFIIRKKGKDDRIIVKNNLEDKTVYLNEDRQISIEKYRAVAVINPERKKYKKEEEISILSALALVLSLLPLIGFAIAVRCIKLINKYRKEYPPELKNGNMAMSVAGLIISIIPSLALIALALLVVALIFGLLLM